MFDRVFANAVAANGGKVNLAVQDGCFVSIEPECPPADTAEEIDLAGHLDILDAAIREGAEVVGGIDPTTLDGDADAQLVIGYRSGFHTDAELGIALYMATEA